MMPIETSTARRVLGLRAGRWSGDEVVVAYVTGHGLKTADVVSGEGFARPWK
jgi:threonine synthase